MATKSVAAEAVPAGNYIETDHFEGADSALKGAIALGAVITEASACQNVAGWSKHIIDDLCVAHHILLQHARMELSALQHEHWYANALLGTYGDEVQADALAKRKMSASA